MGLIIDFFDEIGKIARDSLISAGIKEWVSGRYEREHEEPLIRDMRRLRGQLINRATVRIQRENIDAFNLRHYFDRVMNSIYNENKFPKSDSLNNLNTAVGYWYSSNFQFGGRAFGTYTRNLNTAITANENGNDESINTILVHLIDEKNILERTERFIRNTFYARINIDSINRLMQYAQRLSEIAAMPYSSIGHFLSDLGISLPSPDTMISLYELSLEIKNTLAGLLRTIDFVLEKITAAITNINTRIRTIENLTSR